MSGQQSQQSATTPAPGSFAPDKDAWIRRVLGTDPASGQADDASALQRFKDELNYVRAALKTLAAAPDQPALAARLKQAETLFAAGDVAQGVPQIAALRSEVASALSRARAADAAAVARGSVGRAKLQLAVRQAHAEAVENLRTLCAKVLALPEVREEDRAAEVEAAVKRLADLIPPLDVALEDALGRCDAAKDAAERSAIGRDAAALLAGFQRKLSGNKVLRNIDLFAKSDMAGMKVAQGLTGALADSAAEVGRGA
jgi:hypothetical protein